MQLSVNGVELATEVHGDRTDPVIVMLHGADQNLLAWPDEFVPRLMAGGQCAICFDRWDAGRSTSYPIGAPGYTLRDLAADTTAVIDALQIGAPDGRGGIR